MNTITTYKVVYINSNNIIDEKDFSQEQQARNFIAGLPTGSTVELYEVKTIGSIEKLTI